MKGSFGVARGGLAVLALLASLAGVCGAEETPQEELARKGRAELGRAVASLAPHPSMDTTPVAFTILSTTYRVPRNYLTTMDDWQGGPQGMVTFMLTFPDLKPLSPETAPCLLPGQAHPEGCRRLEVRLRIALGPQTAGTAFENLRKFNPSTVPGAGPDGMQVWTIGSGNNKIEDYWVRDGDRNELFTCQPNTDAPDSDGICWTVIDRISDDRMIEFFFLRRDLSFIRNIEAKVRELINSFVVQPEGQ